MNRLPLLVVLLLTGCFQIAPVPSKPAPAPAPAPAPPAPVPAVESKSVELGQVRYAVAGDDILIERDPAFKDVSGVLMWATVLYTDNNRATVAAALVRTPARQNALSSLGTQGGVRQIQMPDGLRLIAHAKFDVEDLRPLLSIEHLRHGDVRQTRWKANNIGGDLDDRRLFLFDMAARRLEQTNADLPSDLPNMHLLPADDEQRKKRNDQIRDILKKWRRDNPTVRDFLANGLKQK